MSDSILIEISDDLAKVQRMLTSLQAEVQAVKRDVEELQRRESIAPKPQAARQTGRDTCPP